MTAPVIVYHIEAMVPARGGRRARDLITTRLISVIWRAAWGCKLQTGADIHTFNSQPLNWHHARSYNRFPDDTWDGPLRCPCSIFSHQLQPWAEECGNVVCCDCASLVLSYVPDYGGLMGYPYLFPFLASNSASLIGYTLNEAIAVWSTPPPPPTSHRIRRACTSYQN